MGCAPAAGWWCCDRPSVHDLLQLMLRKPSWLSQCSAFAWVQHAQCGRLVRQPSQVILLIGALASCLMVACRIGNLKPGTSYETRVKLDGRVISAHPISRKVRPQVAVRTTSP